VKGGSRGRYSNNVKEGRRVLKTTTSPLHMSPRPSLDQSAGPPGLL